MGQICSLRTIRHRAGESGLAHGASTALTNAALSQGKRLHVQCRSDEGRHIRNHNFSCDVELPERAAFNQVPRIVGFPRIDRKGSLSPASIWGRRKSSHASKKRA